MIKKTLMAGIAAGLTCLAALAGPAAAADYPSKPVQLVVPVGAGGDTDLNARLFAHYLEKELGQSMVIVNIKGAGGTIGMKRVMDAKPDGYTVLFYHGEAMIPQLMGLVNFGLDDFQMAGIGLLDNTTVLAVNKDAPYKTMSEFVSYGKAHPGDIEFAILTGGYPHLVGLALEDATGVKLNLVDVGGNAEKMVALKGNKTDLINIQYGLAKDYFAAGDFVSLGLLSPERNPLIPDVPTTAEQGIPMEFNKFFFFAMPKDTPKEIVDAFSAAIKKVDADPEFQAEAAKIYVTPTYMGPEEAKAYADKQRAVFAKYAAMLNASN